MRDIGTRIPFGTKGVGAKILVSLPNECWIHKTVMQRVMVMLMSERRYHGDLVMPTLRPFENALHHLVEDMVQGGYDFWLNIDSDNPPTRNPLDLVEGNYDILCLPTPVWHWRGIDVEEKGTFPIYWNAYAHRPGTDGYMPAKPVPGQTVEVDAIGTGCFIVARRVFEHPEMRKGPFIRKTLPDGRVDKGNDISFSERAAEAGFKRWVAWTHPCDHFHEINLKEVTEAVIHWQEGLDG